MRISVIVPSNNIERINGFLDSYSSLYNFNSMFELIIIGNGELTKEYIPLIPGITFIRYEEKFDIVPFSELRGIGMKSRYSDYFLFLDDDHRFEDGADIFLIECVNFLIQHSDCGVLQLEKYDNYKYGFYVKKNAHIWTSRGLFIKNINFDYEELFKLKGAGEDLLYGYETLNKGYIPYCIWNTPIKRGCNLPNNYKELNDKSYNEKLLDKNIIGYIRKKYNQPRWKFYGNLKELNYPMILRIIIKNQLKNLI